MTPGISIRARAMAAAGKVLSQPTRITAASSECPRTASSMESAITSREIKEARIPSPPMVMPSETTIVLKSTGVAPPARMPSRTGSANLSRCMLQGVTVDHVFTTAMIGPLSSSSPIPVARSIARAGALAAPLVIASDRFVVIVRSFFPERTAGHEKTRSFRERAVRRSVLLI